MGGDGAAFGVDDLVRQGAALLYPAQPGIDHDQSVRVVAVAAGSDGGPGDRPARRHPLPWVVHAASMTAGTDRISRAPSRRRRRRPMGGRRRRYRRASQPRGGVAA
nr:MAG TPA: hypothetical protein [Caudoviricetes sp.]